MSSAGGSTSRREHYKMGTLIEGGVLSEGDLGRSGGENGRGKGSTRENGSTARRGGALPGVEHCHGSTEGRRALLKAEHCQRERPPSSEAVLHGRACRNRGCRIWISWASPS